MQVVSGEKFSSLGDTLLDRLNTALLAALSACDGQHACPAHGTASGIAAGLGENGPFWTRHYALDKESQVHYILSAQITHVLRCLPLECCRSKPLCIVESVLPGTGAVC